MFVLSFKTKRKNIFLGILLVVVLALVVTAANFVRTARSEATMAGNKYSLKAESNEDRISFLRQFGWEVDPEPAEIREITIPEKFNDVYEKYNEIQKQQGLDLTRYAGKTCKQWIYEIQNYSDRGAPVRATMLVYEGKVIGGDISSTPVDGFMCGFNGAGASGEITPSSEDPGGNAQSGSAEENSGINVSEIPTAAWPTD